MNRDRLYWGASAGAILGYLIAVLTSRPFPIVLDPVAGTWALGSLPDQLVIRWFGYVINAAFGAIVGMAAVWPIRRNVPWHVVWILATAALAYLVFHERHWFVR